MGDWEIGREEKNLIVLGYIQVELLSLMAWPASRLRRRLYGSKPIVTECQGLPL